MIQTYLDETLAGKSFVATTATISIASTETDALLFKNPANSGKNILVSAICYGSSASILTQGKEIFKVYENPTVTANGTSLTKSNMRIGSSNTPAAEVYKLPTTSAKGTKKITRVFNIQNTGTSMEQTMLLEPGNSILVTCESSSNGTDTHIDVNWIEGSI